MQFAALLGSGEHTLVGAGILTRMRAWFAMARLPHAEGESYEHVVEVTDAREPETQSAVVLPFPIRGEALLVKLAEVLRARIATVALSPNLFLLTMSRAPRSCLAIDHASYIAFDAERATFHVVLEASPDTTITLDTTNFDTLVQFVVEYVNGRISEFRTLEVAS